MVKHYYIVRKRLLSFKTNICLCSMIMKSTTKSLVWWLKRSRHSNYASGDVVKTGDKLSLHCVFAVKRVLNQIWNWSINVFRCKLVFTQMVFDSRLHLCDPWNTAYNRKREQEHFWIILWRALELLKGNMSQKTILVTWQYACLQCV